MIFSISSFISFAASSFSSSVSFSYFSFKVSYEKSINGKTVDIVINNGGKKIALEIETCKSDPVGNIEKCLKYGFDTVISIPTTKDCERKIMNQLKEKGLDKNSKIKVIHVFRFRID